MDDKYSEEMTMYEEREKHLKASLYSVQLFLRDDYQKSKEPQKEVSPLNNDKEVIEDDGQIA